jgi:hypothetical protein
MEDADSSRSILSRGRIVAAAFLGCPVRPSVWRDFALEPRDLQLLRLHLTVTRECVMRIIAKAACCRGKTQSSRRGGKVRVDLSAGADLGFQHMMPNTRLFDLRRFTGRGDAIEAARALSRLEAAIPKEHRPDLLRHAEGRLELIDDWWTPVPDRAIA